ncbi:FCD domain-containing protein [Aeromicrobium sp. CFBP 8757]|uniref:FCD domain-containing protein n=1 Tax=Aeromicrobium sp. CFBP 8757 TaxID=2775288 RepID=UPI00177E8A83|nr:FCD domain-containing protein [Aeromicrobium sp. CFBP 8757]
MYRRWAWSLAGDTGRDPASEHRRLMELALERDVDAAVAALEEHIKRASLVLQRWALQIGRA